ncbi:uncharacterized protein [Embiotoca jacksoni]|uniref:uncharacterized protein isoform X1 n=1 Tax=Embiotoca jacksoni TaxID=100190 RepID=UPI0037039D92
MRRHLEGRMGSFSLLGLCLLSLTKAAGGLQSTDQLLMFATEGDSITLPCGIPSITSCSSVNWNMSGHFGLPTEMVKAGKVTVPNGHRHVLLKDCSLEITHLVLNDAQLYSCHSETLNSNVSLQFLQLSRSSTAAEDMMELHCSLNTFKGHIGCTNSRGIHIKWSAEDDTSLNGNRFTFTNPSACFSKLIIRKKLTDHRRKWKCKISQDDVFKATTSYTTTVKDGLEEVFSVVGESVSLPCNNTSPLDLRGSTEWAMHDKTKHFHVTKESSLVIDKVRALHAGDYQCSESMGQQKVLNRVRLHTLDITADSGGDHLTLTCVLSCAKGCEEDFNLTWSGSNHEDWQSTLMAVNNTLIKKVFLPTRSDEITCSVRREGALMASKKWRSVNPLQTPAWLGLPLGLLMCLGAGGLYICMKRKHNKDAANEQSSMGMTHVYEMVQDVNNEEPQRQLKREAAPTVESFYDLLQVVN